MYDNRISNTLTPFIENGAKKKLVPAAIRDMGTWYLRTALDQSLNDCQYPYEQLSNAGFYAFWYMECAHAIMESDDPAGYKLYIDDFSQVSTMLALGWPDHAIRLAKTLLNRWSVQDGGSGSVRWKSLPLYVPWVSVKLYHAWRDADANLDHQPENDELGGFSDLVETLLHPNSQIFKEAFLKAADFHALGSGTGDDDPVRDYYNWFFPTELLAACRIRELRGLEVPHIKHPLLDAAPLCRLQPSFAKSVDQFLPQVLLKFAQVTGKLDLRI